ncbi:hypothetical protein LO771_10890 [Streptacidiphilus sp. ASG 303]|uniref:hypothetical protein n=1 Tax=Streptacidiphilus sp. ASG 303 TaxID=2896847 RepID=UPI001E53CC6C|nr:hypothetical protein [Streptacidiphilus sp. ASG 303]MCD0482892.1 hypothetical protein [Streptacidiphilus sp. ASG 303]
MLNNSRRAVVLGLGLPMLALSLTVAVPAATASADPGFCGVRADVSDGGGPTGIVYTVYNRCKYKHSFKVYLPSAGRTSKCESAPPGGYAYFLFQFADEDWQVRACS